MTRRCGVVILVCLITSFVFEARAEEPGFRDEIGESNQGTEPVDKKHEVEESIFKNTSIGGIAAGAFQHQFIGGSHEAEDHGRGAAVFQPEISFTPTDHDEILLKFGFGAKDALNKVSPFALASWAADLEDDVKDINGRGRDYLLTAWYKHTVEIGADHSLALTGGIIDATDYLDENAYANDEFTQFMNEALVNGPNGFAPSYDAGAAAEWEYNRISLKGVIMDIGENDDGNSYTFWGSQLGFRLTTDVGEGTYRLVYENTTDDFLNSAGTREESCQAWYLSCNQEFGPVFGGWIRFGIHDDDHTVTYQNLLSGGINVTGALWGRKQDTLGIGYAFLNQGSADIDRTHIAEAYLRFVLNEITSLTFDVQYEDDDYRASADDDIHGWVTGMRLTAEF